MFVFCSWTRIVLEWLHHGCDNDLSAEFLNFGAGDFLLWRRDPSGFGAASSDAVARRSIVLCNSVFANRIVMAASRLLGAAAACVILFSFAAGHRTSYWSGCIKAGMMICQQIESA